jgi:hypothetical protein
MMTVLTAYLVGVILTALWLMRGRPDKSPEIPLRFYIFGSLIVAILWPLAVIEVIYSSWRDHENC